MQIGTYIKLILQKKNMTQQQLADKLQVPKQNISNIIIIVPKISLNLEISSGQLKSLPIIKDNI